MSSLTTPVATTRQKATSALEAARRLITPRMRDAIATLPANLQESAAHHFGWPGPGSRGENANGGKALRPALVLCAAAAVGGSAEAAVPAAVAVELIHNFTLIHDDVMDGDATRRNRPTVWKVYGVGQAILTGDALLALAFQVLAESCRGHGDATGLLVNAIVDLVKGQGNDLRYEASESVSTTDAIDMARRKTGALFQCSTALGALIGGGTTDQVECLKAFGSDLGLAFQLTDDVLGIWGDPRITGKPIYSDLRRRKRSLPVVVALASGTRHAADLAEAYRQDGHIAESRLAQLAHAIDRAGGRTWCVQYAERLLQSALNKLSRSTSLRHAGDLTALARLAACRDH